MIIAQTIGSVSASNGDLPVKSSYRITPSDQRSVRPSTFFDDIICSGDI